MRKVMLIMAALMALLIVPIVAANATGGSPGEEQYPTEPEVTDTDPGTELVARCNIASGKIVYVSPSEESPNLSADLTLCEDDETTTPSASATATPSASASATPDPCETDPEACEPEPSASASATPDPEPPVETPDPETPDPDEPKPDKPDENKPGPDPNFGLVPLPTVLHPDRGGDGGDGGDGFVVIEQPTVDNGGVVVVHPEGQPEVVREVPLEDTDGSGSVGLDETTEQVGAAFDVPTLDQYESPAPVDELPETGGARLLALGAGALIVAGGLIARRIVK